MIRSHVINVRLLLIANSVFKNGLIPILIKPLSSFLPPLRLFDCLTASSIQSDTFSCNILNRRFLLPPHSFASISASSIVSYLQRDFLLLAAYDKTIKCLSK